MPTIFKESLAPSFRRCLTSINIVKVLFLLLICLIAILIVKYKDFFNHTCANVDSRTLTLYKKQSIERKELIKNLTVNDGYTLLYNLLVPEVFCMNLVRIGRVVDGGKWICNPSALLSFNECTVYSLGLSNEPSFEIDLQKFLNNKCNVRSFDKDDQNLHTMEKLANINGIFMKALISNKTDESKSEFTFMNILDKFGDKRIDILKVDIETAEFEILDELLSTPICQLLIEIHGKNVVITLDFIKQLSRHGFYLFSYEISEFSFIHERCLNEYGVNIVYGKYLS